MPTSRPRHVVTETPQVSRALDDAAARWPEDSQSRSKLLLHLVEEGHHVLLETREREVLARRRALAETAGSLTGMYGAGYLEELREDWPS